MSKLEAFVKSAVRPVWRRINNRILANVLPIIRQDTIDTNRIMVEKIAELNSRISSLESHAGQDSSINEQFLARLYVPVLEAPGVNSSAPFMKSSTCSAEDFTHPQYYAICKMLCGKPVWHRKQWEWVYIIHKLMSADVLALGNRGLGFGVGGEALPALFASLGAHVVATDAPSDVGLSAGWQNNNEFSQSLDALRAPWICPDDTFSTRVSFRPVDMNAIDDDLENFDFTWSSCCLEHLGSLSAGMQFVINSVEKTLRVGGIACHTTEFNVSSDTETVESGGTVIYRKRDIEELIACLKDRGHHVEPLVIGASNHHLDNYIDVPPYAKEPHLKLRLAGHVTTSIGLVIRRGR